MNKFQTKLRNDELLFGECPSLIVVSLNEEDLYELVLLSKKYNVHTQTIGKVSDDGILEINDIVKVDKKDLNKCYKNSFKDIMETIHE